MAHSAHRRPDACERTALCEVVVLWLERRTLSKHVECTLLVIRARHGIDKSSISVALRWMLLNGLVLISPKNVLDGIKVVDAAGEHSDQTMRSLHEALQVISQTDPRRFERLRRDLRRIVLVKAGNPEFASEAGACLIASGYVRQNSPEAVATTIVHEAVHARLHRRGIGYGPTMRSRVEEVCVREQIAFAERLRNAEIVSLLRQRLNGSLWLQLRGMKIAWLRYASYEFRSGCFGYMTDSPG
jgi:hypothetical protein